MKKLTMVFAGVLAAAVIAVVSGCFNPVQPRARIPSSAGVPATDGTSTDGTSTDGTSTDGTSENASFTVTLQVGSEGPDSRAVAGPNATGIQYTAIRNIAQVIVIRADTGEVENFQQLSRKNNQDTSDQFTVSDLWVGSRYHFLVLMGHRERDYAAESDPDVEYKYKDDSPTLLAAGLLEAQEITAGTNLIPIRMYPLIVDTVFRQGENVVQAALPSAQPGGARLFSEIDTEVVWTLTGGFAELLRAQDKIKPEGGRGSDPLPNSAKKTWFRIGGESPGDSPNESNAVLSGAGLNQITLDLGAQNEGAAGSAAFNVTYLPFGAGNLEVFTDVFTDIDQNAAGWIIRNGVNDKAQDGKTVFPNTAEINSPWNDQTGDTGRNGNGAVAFTVEKKMISPIDLTSLVPAPAAGQPIAGYTSASGDQYSVAVSWIPASGAFEKGKSYTATVILTAKEGWAFGEGLGAGFFSHEAAASIVMLGGNNLVGLRLTFLLPDDSGDSDGDGFSDNMETANGFKPNNKNDNPAAAGSGSLTITGGTVKKLKAGQPITIEFTLGGFTGNANLYYTVAAQGAAAPALNTYPETSGRLVASGAQTLDVTDAVNAAAAALGKTWKDGYDVYLVLMQNGKAARRSVRVPKLVDLNVGG